MKTPYLGWVRSMHISSEIRRWGNSLGLVIPAKIARKLGIKEGESVDVDIRKKTRVDGFGIFSGERPFREEKEHEDLW